MRRAQELTDANCAARVKLAKLLLQKFPQYATDFVFFTDEKMFSVAVASPDNWQKKSQWQTAGTSERKNFFSVCTARSAAAWPPDNCACCVTQLFERLINTTLCPMSSFYQEIRLSTSLLCIPSNTNFLSKSCPRRLIPYWLLTNTTVTSAVTNFRCHKLIAKVNN